MLFVKYVIAAAIIFAAGYRLTKYADILAEKWGIAQHVMGFVLLSIITALPELCASSTPAYIGNADLALGNLFGSNAFNLFLIVILDFLNRGRPIIFQADRTVLYTARLGIILIVIAVLGIALSNGATLLYLSIFNRLKFYQVGLISVVIVIVYLWESKKIFDFSQKKQNSGAVVKLGGDSTKSVLYKFFAAAALIVAAGVYVSKLADQISLLSFRGTMLGGTLVGTFFLAVATSLPELAVTISAVKRGLYSMALGNILGSNLVNMHTIFWADMFYRPGTIFSAAGSLHIFSGCLAIVLTSIVAWGIISPLQKTFCKINLLTLAMLVTYLGGFWIIFTFR